MSTDIDDMARTTVAFAGKDKEKLEKAVIDIIIATKEKITLSEIVHTCVTEYLDEAVKDIKDRRKHKSTN